MSTRFTALFSFLSGLLTGGMDCSRVLLIVPLWMLSRTVSTECDRWRWAISWTNQFAWPSGLQFRRVRFRCMRPHLVSYLVSYYITLHHTCRWKSDLEIEWITSDLYTTVLSRCSHIAQHFISNSAKWKASHPCITSKVSTVIQRFVFWCSLTGSSSISSKHFAVKHFLLEGA